MSFVRNIVLTKTQLMVLSNDAVSGKKNRLLLKTKKLLVFQMTNLK